MSQETSGEHILHGVMIHGQIQRIDPTESATGLGTNEMIHPVGQDGQIGEDHLHVRRGTQIMEMRHGDDKASARLRKDREISTCSRTR